MANVVINDTHLTNIAAAIREKNGTSNTYAPKDMAAAITDLPSGTEELAYAVITHNSTDAEYPTEYNYDLSNYITPSGTIYFITQYNTTTYVSIIQNGALIDTRYGLNGNIFAVNGFTTPKFELDGKVLKIHANGVVTNYFKPYGSVIYLG